MEPSNYVMEFAADDIQLEVWLNGVLLVNADATGGFAWTSKVDGWVAPTGNVIEVWLAAAPLRTAGVRTPRFKLTLSKTYMGASTAADANIAQYEWRASEQPLGQNLTRVFAAAVTMAPPGIWRWLGAEVLTDMSPSHRGAIADLLEELANALRSRDVARVVALQTLQLQEMALAMGQNGQGMLVRYGEFLRERMAAADWRVEATAPAELVMATMAGGRIWHVAAPHARPPLRCYANDSLFAPDPYFARLAGRWTIVR
jgi:hypothetical protein